MPLFPSSAVCSVIAPLTPADDFARQLSFDELAALATATTAERGGVVCSLGPNGIAAIRREHASLRWRRK